LQLDKLFLTIRFHEVNEEEVIYLFGKKKEIVRKDVETALAVSQAMAVRILRSLSEKQTIRAIGRGKKTRYVKADRPIL
jgi:Fic family protein